MQKDKRDIKPTRPVTGKDAIELWDVLRANSHKKASKEEIDRIRQNAQELKNIMKC